jgi:predicted PurR-regulated permease PerM
VPRAITVLVVYLAVIGILTLMSFLLWPALTEQWQQFVDQLPRLIEGSKRWLGIVGATAERWGGRLPTPDPKNLEGLAGTLIANTLRVTAGALGALFGLLTIIVLSAYIVIDAERLGHGLLQLFPPDHRSVVAGLGRPVLDIIGAYVRGQIAVSLCVGAILAVGLSLLGVRYGLLIGALAAVLNVVPFVGSLVASLLGILSALSESMSLAVATALLFWGTNALEGKLLVPQLVGRATGLHPLAVLFALLAGAHLAGLVGALVAVPAVAALWEIVLGLYVRRRRSRPEGATPPRTPRGPQRKGPTGGWVERGPQGAAPDDRPRPPRARSGMIRGRTGARLLR